MSSNHRSRTKLLATALIVAGLASLAWGAWLYFDQPTPPPPTSSHRSEAPPSATKPSKQIVDAYTVAADMPKYIDIPAINVAKTRLIQFGVMQNNQIAVPDNLYDAGWYKASAKPGEDGAMFVFGHVSSWQAKGIFYDLQTLQPGDKISITRGDNKQFIYRVMAKKLYDHAKVDMKTVFTPIKAGRPGLNLMTCAGHVIKGTNEFSERLVVFTTLE